MIAFWQFVGNAVVGAGIVIVWIVVGAAAYGHYQRRARERGRRDD